MRCLHLKMMGICTTSICWQNKLNPVISWFIFKRRQSVCLKLVNCPFKDKTQDQKIKVKLCEPLQKILLLVSLS